LSDADFIPLYHAFFLKRFPDYAVNMNVLSSDFAIVSSATVSSCTDPWVRLQRRKWSDSPSTVTVAGQGRLTAYDAGTGMLPPTAGGGLGRDLIWLHDAELKKAGVEQCLLEVLSNNLRP